MRSREKEMFACATPRGLMQRTENLLVPMVGIRQIPREADELFKLGYEDLPPEIEAVTDDAIAEAMAEHRRRRDAVKAGMDLDDYFSPDREDDA